MQSTTSTPSPSALPLSASPGNFACSPRPSLSAGSVSRESSHLHGRHKVEGPARSEDRVLDEGPGFHHSVKYRWRIESLFHGILPNHGYFEQQHPLTQLPLANGHDTLNLSSFWVLRREQHGEQRHELLSERVGEVGVKVKFGGVYGGQPASLKKCPRP